MTGPCVTTGSYELTDTCYWTGHSAFDWLTLLTAVLADKPLGGRDRSPWVTGRQPAIGLVQFTSPTTGSYELTDIGWYDLVLMN